MVLQAGQLGSQLLSSSGIDPESEVEVYSNYADAQQQLSFSLGPNVEPGKTVFVSVLVAPKLQSHADQQGDIGFTTFDLDDEDAFGPRTQLYYNCTSVSHIADLLQDANVESLVSFDLTTIPANTSEASANGPELFASKTNVSASAEIRIHDCGELRNYSVGQIVYRNAFFPDEQQDDAATSWPLRVISSNVISSQEHCIVSMEMVQASLSDLYPHCRMKYSSTDIASLAQEASENIAVQDPSRHEATRRRLDASSFEFIRNPLCSTACGYYSGDEVDECRTSSYIKLACRVQFYEAVPDCYNECGDDYVLPSQCLSKSDYYRTAYPCITGYAAASLTSCARIISCRAISENATSATQSLSWNLDVNGRIVNPAYVMYQKGECSDPTDPRSTCCRITCENCFIDLKVAAIHADIDLDLSVDAHVTVVGSASVTFAIYSPNGCYFTTGDYTLLSKEIASRGLITMKLSFVLSHRFDFSFKPHGSLARYGWLTNIQTRAGMLNSASFKDVVVNTTANRGIGSSAIDVSAAYVWTSAVAAEISFLDAAAVVMKVALEAYSRLNANVSFPDPFPSRQAVAYNPKSSIKYGDCSRPHFMSFEGTVGINEPTASFTATLPLYGEIALTTTIFPSHPSYDTSVFSGCIASVYEAKLLLVAARSMNATQLQRLAKMLAWALGFPAINPSSIQIGSVSDVDGSISVTFPVPPSIGESYPTASDLQTQMYANARSAKFVDLMTSEVGFQVASVCDDGWWGPSCSNRCDASTCRSVSCNAVDGTVMSCGSCQTGYWGSKCEYSCKSDYYHHCAEGATVCNKDSGDVESCDRCVRGFYGYGCTSECSTSSTCISPSCAQDGGGTITSCEACTTGFWDTKCRSSCPDDNVHRCAAGGTRCAQSNGNFVSCNACRDGYWRDPCDQVCPTSDKCLSPSCSRYSGDLISCGSCKQGYWGLKCDKSCVDDGVHRCAANAAVCDKDSGTITSCSACSEGYWGASCAFKCNFPSHCIGGVCTQSSGTIVACSACEDGYWGSTCAWTCTADGYHQCADGAMQCAQSNGEFVSCIACRSGYWYDCAAVCPASTNCISPGCSRWSGDLISCGSCETGYWGSKCTQPCAVDDIHHCGEGASSCAQDSGSFTSCSACLGGYWGDGCTEACPLSNNCISPHCTQYSGDITWCESCEPGYWGETCGQTCFNDGVHRCAPNAAVCYKGWGGISSCSACSEGYWGADCSSRCELPLHCSGGDCTQSTGEFMACSACEDSYWGPECTESCVVEDNNPCAEGATRCAKDNGEFDSCSACPSGFWRDSCTQVCPARDNCVSPSCTQSSGELVSCESCAPGYWGEKCDQVCIDDSTHRCAPNAAVCYKSWGGILSCSACSEGYWGADCSSRCELPTHCATGACAQWTGVFSSCSACEDSYWGSECTQSCVADDTQHCENGALTCLQDSGSVTSCSACRSGYWRDDCTEACPSSPNCISSSCTQYGGEVTCDSCMAGYWGRKCEKACEADSTHRCAASATVCDNASGAVLACSACSKGYWGAVCSSKCELPAHCVEGVCAQSTGALTACSACEEGFQGDQCATAASTKASSASDFSMAALAMQLALAAAVAAVALSLR